MDDVVLEDLPSTHLRLNSLCRLGHGGTMLRSGNQHGRSLCVPSLLRNV